MYACRRQYLGFYTRTYIHACSHPTMISKIGLAFSPSSKRCSFCRTGLRCLTGAHFTVDLHKTENQSSDRRMEAGGEGGAQDATRYPRHMGGCPTSPPPKIPWKRAWILLIPHEVVDRKT